MTTITNFCRSLRESGFFTDSSRITCTDERTARTDGHRRIRCEAGKENRRVFYQVLIWLITQRRLRYRSGFASWSLRLVFLKGYVDLQHRQQIDLMSGRAVISNVSMRSRASFVDYLRLVEGDREALVRQKARC